MCEIYMLINNVIRVCRYRGFFFFWFMFGKILSQNLEFFGFFLVHIWFMFGGVGKPRLASHAWLAGPLRVAREAFLAMYCLYVCYYIKMYESGSRSTVKMTKVAREEIL